VTRSRQSPRRLMVAMACVMAGLGAGSGRAETQPVSAAKTGEWTSVGPSGGSLGGAAVYCPTRKQVLRWGGLKSGNEVRAFDAETGQWAADYASDKAEVGGNFYGGQGHAAWLSATNRPGPSFLFRQACWDSTRSRLVIVAENLTAAYDPATRQWTDLKAAYEDAQGKRTPGAAPAKGGAAWFAPVPVQWGSCAYDPVNDEIVLFPQWVTRATTWNYGATDVSGPVLPDDAGVRAGHYGTFLFDCKTNTWRTPELGGKEVLATRARLAVIINEQRQATREGWQVLIEYRQGKLAGEEEWKKHEIIRAMHGPIPAQQSVLVKVEIERGKLEKAIEGLTGDEARQVQETLESLRSVSESIGRTAPAFFPAKPEDLPALCAQQQAIYRKLRLVRDEDLYVQPTPRCSTSVVYDSKNKVMVMAGGDHLDRRLNDTWVYECATRRWHRRQPAPEAADWPGMCYDAKRGLVLYAAEGGTYGYDAAKDTWVRLGAGRPRGAYCDLAYDESRDLYVLNVANDKFGADETTWVMAGGGEMTPVVTTVATREVVSAVAFPPPTDAAALERLKTMPANTWVRAKPAFEPTHRSWSTMSWDPTLRCVIYQGGGHAGTMDNTVSAYFPESNAWVNAFPSQYPPRVFGAWSDAGGFPAFERGMGCAQHSRYYESLDGVVVHGSSAGFAWSTRERPIDFRPCQVPFRYVGGFCLHPTKKQILQLGKSAYYDQGHGGHLSIHDLATGDVQVVKTTGPVPQITTEWSAIAVHPDRNLLVVHGAGDHQTKADTETWVLDLKDPKSWRRLELKSTTPPVGMAKLNAIPGTPYLVCAMPASNDLWVLDLDRKTWRPLPVQDGDDRLGARRRFDLYGQCVWDPHHRVFVMVGLRGGYETRFTFLLRPDFGQVAWEGRASSS
jgi:hypothetical protein